MANGTLDARESDKAPRKKQTNENNFKKKVINGASRSLPFYLWVRQLKAKVRFIKGYTVLPGVSKFLFKMCKFLTSVWNVFRKRYSNLSCNITYYKHGTGYFMLLIGRCSREGLFLINC